MKMGIFLTFFVMFILWSSPGSAGGGPSATEQHGLLEECKDWKLGNKIPQYLIDSTQFNAMGLYKPTDYIREIDNEELLFTLMVAPNAPDFNREVALQRLLEKLELRGFKSLLDKMIRENAFEKNTEVEKIKEIFSGKCLRMYDFYIDLTVMPKEEALKVLSQMKTEMDSGKDIMQVYEIYRKKSEYLNYDGDEIGNGGDFYISEVTSKIFPSSREFYAPKVDLNKILKLKLGESIILEESATKEDRELKEKDILTTTQDALNLCVIIDELPELLSK